MFTILKATRITKTGKTTSFNAGIFRCNYAPVEVEPVGDDINAHRQLKEEHIARVEVAQYHQQTHGGSAVSQLIQHCTELGTWK